MGIYYYIYYIISMRCFCQTLVQYTVLLYYSNRYTTDTILLSQLHNINSNNNNIIPNLKLNAL